jgi:hypothetical protein
VIPGRRGFLLGCAGALVACGGAPREPAPPPELTLALTPVADLLPAPRLEWLVELRCREAWSHPGLRAAIRMVIPDERLAGFAVTHGGVDLREIDELAIAGYAPAASPSGNTVVVARTMLDPARVEAAFTREVDVQGRASTHPDARHPLVRVWGLAASEPRSLVLFGRRALLLERGPGVASRAAVAFAEGRMHRSRPALLSPPLDAAARLAGSAPLRVFFPGPFGGAASRGLGGILAASTAAVLTARPEGAALRGDAWVLGHWADDAAGALERLAATYDALAKSELGRLCGLHTVTPTLTSTHEALHAEARFDPLIVARGLHATLDASVDEIMK